MIESVSLFSETEKQHHRCSQGSWQQNQRCSLGKEASLLIPFEPFFAMCLNVPLFRYRPTQQPSREFPARSGQTSHVPESLPLIFSAEGVEGKWFLRDDNKAGGENGAFHVSLLSKNGDFTPAADERLSLSGDNIKRRVKFKGPCHVFLGFRTSFQRKPGLSDQR